MFSDHSRWKVDSKAQHPYNHAAADIAFTSTTGSLPSGVAGNMQATLDYLLAVLYPQTKASVANVAALPSMGNTLNDYRIVADNGHGVAGGYRWEQREGDAAAKWYEIYAFNWGADSIMSQFLNQTQNVYVNKYGFDDIDSTGAYVTGILAGQTIYGGRSAGNNLTFYPNAGDAGGSVTGFIQTAATFRATVDNAVDIGSTSGSNRRFRTGYFATSILAGTMTLAGGSIADSSGAISFGALNLSTTGTFSAGAVSFSSMTAGNLSFSGDTIATTDANGDLLLAPNGTGSIRTVRCYPAADATSDLGKTAARYANLYLSGSLGDGTNLVSIATLLTLRSINSGATNNYVASYNSGTGLWGQVNVNTLVSHPSIQSLTSGGTDGDAGHSQFVVAAGRAAAQTIYGGTGAGQNLTLSSTNNASKGFLYTDSTVSPTAGVDNAIDLGQAASNRFRNLYMAGQAIGQRTENYTTGGRPGAAAGTAGRHYWDTTTKQLYTDNGGTWIKSGLELTLVTDTTGWTGSVTSVVYMVSSTCADARNCIWALQNSSHKQILADISMTQTQVTVSVDIALAAGTYYLVGVG